MRCFLLGLSHGYGLGGMFPAGGGAQELGVPLGAVAGRVGGSPQAVGLLPMGSGFGNGWWSTLLGAAGLKAWPCALPAMGRAVLLVGHKCCKEKQKQPCVWLGFGTGRCNVTGAASEAASSCSASPHTGVEKAAK